MNWFGAYSGYKYTMEPFSLYGQEYVVLYQGCSYISILYLREVQLSPNKNSLPRTWMETLVTSVL